LLGFNSGNTEKQKNKKKLKIFLIFSKFVFLESIFEIRINYETIKCFNMVWNIIRENNFRKL
jgi:hypothetical protein